MQYNALQAQQPVFDPAETPAWLAAGIAECAAQDAEDREEQRQIAFTRQSHDAAKPPHGG